MTNFKNAKRYLKVIKGTMILSKSLECMYLMTDSTRTNIGANVNKTTCVSYTK